jgi:hypothetical protein
MDELDVIKQDFRSGDYRYTQHAVERTTERMITRNEIEQAIENGEIIENYPDDKYGPSCLIYGSTDGGRPLHLQCSLPPKVKLITVYEPDPAEWIDNRIRRST